MRDPTCNYVPVIEGGPLDPTGVTCKIRSHEVSLAEADGGDQVSAVDWHVLAGGKRRHGCHEKSY